MRVEFIGHASILVEVRGMRILSDPWWRGPCFGAQWWNYPNPVTDQVYKHPVDFIYISHGHHDHCHPGTLATLDRSSKVIVSSTLDLKPVVQDLGFEVIEIHPEQPFDLGNGVKIWLWPTYGGDTLLVISDGDQTCINLNDAIHTAPARIQERVIENLKQQFGRPDYIFCGYGTASHFPNCYFVPGKNPSLTARRRQQYFNRCWSDIIHRLQPRWGFPFAASVIFLEDDLLSLNEDIHNYERPTDVFKNEYPLDDTKVLDIAPGFVIEDQQVISECLFAPYDNNVILDKCCEQYQRANIYGTTADIYVEELVQLLRNNIEICLPYLIEYVKDYFIVIEFRGSDKGISVRKQGQNIYIEPVTSLETAVSQADLIFRTRAAYLRRSLTHQYGDEIIFVGSGGVFIYPTREHARLALHSELRVMITQHSHAPASRFGSSTPGVFRLKQVVKQLLGKRDLSADLYDLEAWTDFSSPASSPSS